VCCHKSLLLPDRPLRPNESPADFVSVGDLVEVRLTRDYKGRFSLERLRDGTIDLSWHEAEKLQPEKKLLNHRSTASSTHEEEQIRLQELFKTQRSQKSPKQGTECVGKVVNLTDFGAFVDVGTERPLCCHKSSLVPGRIGRWGDPRDFVALGDILEVRVVLDYQGRLSLERLPQGTILNADKRSSRPLKIVGIEQSSSTAQS